MNVGTVIHNIEDFFNKRIQKELLEYNLRDLKTEVMEKKKETGKTLKYSHGLFLLLEGIEEAEIYLRRNEPDEKEFFNIIEKFKKAEKTMTEDMKEITEESLTREKVTIDRSILKTKKIILPDTIETQTTTQDDKVARLREELENMKVSSVSKLASITSNLDTLDNNPPSPVHEKVEALDSKKEDKLSKIKEELDTLKLSSSDKTRQTNSEDAPATVVPKPADEFRALPKMITSRTRLSQDNSTYKTLIPSSMENPGIKDSKDISHTEENRQTGFPDEIGTGVKKTFNINQKSRFNIDKLIPALTVPGKDIGKIRTTIQVPGTSTKGNCERKTNVLSPIDIENTEQSEEFHKEKKSNKTTKELVESELKIVTSPLTDRENNMQRQNMTEQNAIYQSDFINPFETKTKLSPYYDLSKNKEIKYSEDVPVDSPLYSLLIGYEDLKAYKIDFKHWMEKKSEGEEELNYILNNENFRKIKPEESERLEELINLTLSVMEELQMISKEVIADSTRKAIYELKKGIYGECEEDQEIKELIEDLRDLNMEIYEVIEEILPTEIPEPAPSLEEQMAQIPEDNYKTPNYVNIEKTALDFLKKKIPRETFMKALNKMIDLIQETREKYDSLQVSDNELTIEVFKASQIISEALDDWEQGVLFLKEYISSRDKDDIYEGLKLVYDGNKKLVFIQYFAQQVEKQAQVQTFHTEFSTARKKGLNIDG